MGGQNPGVTSRRVAARVPRDFGPTESDSVLKLLEGQRLPLLYGHDEGHERVQAAVVLIANGDSSRLLEAVALAETDWRDVLMAAGLAHGDWRQRVEIALGASGEATQA